MSSEVERGIGATQTFWESTAETRWGRYITEIERHALLSAATSFSSPGLGLEIGCEGGRWSRMLADLGWQMTATDINPDALRICEERIPTVRCILTQPTDTMLPADTDSINLLLCLEVPPIADQLWFYSEAARVLKSGGKLVATHNNLLSWRGAAAALKSSLRRGKHFYNVPFPTIKRALAAQGFTIDTARGCCWPPFGRHSNSRLVPTATTLERSLGLQRLPSVSPWIVYSATRQ